MKKAEKFLIKVAHISIAIEVGLLIIRDRRMAQIVESQVEATVRSPKYAWKIAETFREAYISRIVHLMDS